MLLLERPPTRLNCYDEDAIKGILDQYDKASSQEGRARVQLAILKMSTGRMDYLHEWVKAAIAESRDVLMSAEAPTMVSSASSEEKQRAEREANDEQYRKWLFNL